jgi:transcriptional regulator with XRE-family HTH domain
MSVTQPLDLVRLAEVRRAARSGAARRLRELAGVSQGELAAALGVTPSAISYYEAGKRRPSAVIAERWATALLGWASALADSDNEAVRELLGTAELLRDLGTDR